MLFSPFVKISALQVERFGPDLCCMSNVYLPDHRAVAALRYLVPLALVVYMENSQIVVTFYVFVYAFQAKPIFTFDFSFVALEFVAFSVGKLIETDNFER